MMLWITCLYLFEKVWADGLNTRRCYLFVIVPYSSKNAPHTAENALR